MDTGIIGDMTGIDLPETPTNDDYITELRKKARYSKSKEFKELQESVQLRIDYYTHFLPDGRLIASLSPEEAQKYWPVANIVIAELKALLSGYDGSVELLKEIDEEK